MLTTITAAPLIEMPSILVPARKVVVLVADAETQSLMRRWCEDQGFDLAASYGGEPRPASEFEFHLTLFATVGTSTLPDQAHEIEYAYAVPEGFEALGADQDTPTLRVADPDGDLEMLRGEWLALTGGEPTYPVFKPHVSLSYAWNGTPALDTLPLPPFVLAFDRLEVSTLDDAPAAMPAKRKASMRSRISVKSALAEAQSMRDRAAVWIDHVEQEYAFDFSAYGDTVEDVEVELDGALEAVGELAPLVKLLTEKSEQAAAARDQLDEAVSEFDDIASDCQMALETAGDAVEQLQARLAQLSGEQPKSSGSKLATKANDLALDATTRAAFDGNTIAQILIWQHDDIVAEIDAARARVDSGEDPDRSWYFAEIDRLTAELVRIEDALNALLT